MQSARSRSEAHMVDRRLVSNLLIQVCVKRVAPSGCSCLVWFVFAFFCRGVIATSLLSNGLLTQCSVHSWKFQP